MLFNNRTLIEKNNNLMISAASSVIKNAAFTSSALAKALRRIAKKSSTDLL